MAKNDLAKHVQHNQIKRSQAQEIKKINTFYFFSPSLFSQDSPKITFDQKLLFSVYSLSQLLPLPYVC